MIGGRRRVTNTPYRFSAADAGVRRPAAYRGEHNYEALGEWLGCSDARRTRLSSKMLLLSGFAEASALDCRPGRYQCGEKLPERRRQRLPLVL